MVCGGEAHCRLVLFVLCRDALSVIKLCDVSSGKEARSTSVLRYAIIICVCSYEPFYTLGCCSNLALAPYMQSLTHVHNVNRYQASYIKHSSFIIHKIFISMHHTAQGSINIHNNSCPPLLLESTFHIILPAMNCTLIDYAGNWIAH